MVFSSVEFLFRFLPIFVILYFAVSISPASRRVRNLILFLGSLVFYAWGEPVYVLLMLFSTVADFGFGLLIDKFGERGFGRLFLAGSVTVNLLVLCFFKYADFLIQTINQATGTKLPLLNLPLPLGISFYTFQTMSYTIDVYRRKAKVQKNLLDFAVFVTMFPQLIAGPIVRYQDVQEELLERKVDLIQISEGCKRFITGLAKKVLLANTIGALWDEISAMEYGMLPVGTAWLGVFAFALQLYFDFSGYSDMAIGLGSILGFHFPENFNFPYISASVTEFWRRWHISLGTWFREYVYIPLGGNRKGKGRQVINLLIVWTLAGLWHGAGWNFVLWGLWYALFLILEKLFLGKLLERLPRVIGWLYTAFVVLCGWVLFTMEGFSDIGSYFLAMFGGNQMGFYNDRTLYLALEYGFLLLIGVVLATPLIKSLKERLQKAGSGLFIAIRRFLEKLILAVLFLASVAYLVAESYNPFLYFRF